MSFLKRTPPPPSQVFTLSEGLLLAPLPSRQKSPFVLTPWNDTVANKPALVQQARTLLLIGMGARWEFTSFGCANYTTADPSDDASTLTDRGMVVRLRYPMLYSLPQGMRWHRIDDAAPWSESWLPSQARPLVYGEVIQKGDFQVQAASGDPLLASQLQIGQCADDRAGEITGQNLLYTFRPLPEWRFREEGEMLSRFDQYYRHSEKLGEGDWVETDTIEGTPTLLEEEESGCIRTIQPLLPWRDTPTGWVGRPGDRYLPPGNSGNNQEEWKVLTMQRPVAAIAWQTRRSDEIVKS